MVDVLVLPTAEAPSVLLAAARRLMDDAFGDDPEEAFGDDDWDDALGGTHVVVVEDGLVLAHAALVERTLHAADRSLRTATSRPSPPAPIATARASGRWPSRPRPTWSATGSSSPLSAPAAARSTSGSGGSGGRDRPTCAPTGRGRGPRTTTTASWSAHRPLGGAATWPARSRGASRRRLVTLTPPWPGPDGPRPPGP